MWHELVLNGVGGNTIADAKNNLSADEFARWLEYRNLRGSLSGTRRLEQAMGQLCLLVVNAAGVKKSDGMRWSPTDFMPHELPIKTQQDIDDEKALDDMPVSEKFKRLN